MDFVCDIASCFGNIFSFLFDKHWWKDYGIPLIGTVGIPLVVWILTRYYGADKAEERKEIRQLRDNLNLILSVSLDSISKLIALREMLLKLNRIEKKYEPNLKALNINDISTDDWSILGQIYMLPIKLDVLNIANYTPCIAVSENYALHLMKLISACEIVVFKIECRNSDLRRISECNDLQLKHALIRERISLDISEFNSFVKTLDITIACLKNFIRETKELENKYKGLLLDTITYSEDYKNYLKEVEDNLKNKGTD